MSTIPKPKAGIMDIRPYVAGKREAGKEAGRILKLSSNESALGASPCAVRAFIDHAATLHRYPDPGAAALREAIGRAHGLDAHRIVCGSGSDELIALLTHAYAGAGDEVLISRHGFLMYKIYAQSVGAACVEAPEKNLTADVDALLACVSAKTRIVYLANPNNPTGSYLPAAQVKRLRAGLPPHVILAIDGAYAEFVEPSDYRDGRELVDAGDNTVMLRTFSKIYGLSSLRLGWGYYPASIADVMHRLRGPFNVSGAAQAAGIAAVEDRSFVAKAKAHNTQWSAWLAKELSGCGLIAHPSAANFILTEFQHTAKTAKAANAFLLERGIIVRDVVAYGLPDALRITIGTEEENHAVAKALREFLK